MKSAFKVVAISAEQAIDLRSRILRPGQNLEKCHYAEDNFATSFHFGIFKGSRVLCNGTFLQQRCEHFPNAKFSYRLRGMATDSEFQRQGLGALLLNYAESYLKEKKCDLLWFNARLSAEIFYQKLGFKQLDHAFEIPTIGLHRVMFKWLSR